MDDLSFEIGGGASWDAVAGALKEVDDSMTGDLELAVRTVARIVAAQCAEAVMDEPVHGLKHTALRARIAAGTSADDIPGGADITAGLPGDDSALPMDMDEGGWDHPVFGDRTNWVSQDGYFSWFTDTVEAASEQFDEAVEAVLDAAMEKIQGS